MKRFIIDGQELTFDVVQNMGDGSEYAVCICGSRKGDYAFLDVDNGVQFENENRIVAKPYINTTFCIPKGFHCWGGELRCNETWRKQWT